MRPLILAFAAIAPLLLVLLWWRGLPLAGIGVLALSHALLLIPTLMPNVQWLGPVITHFATNANELWLTIDDGPTDDTTAMLDALDARGVKATFFLVGTLAKAHPERVQEIVNRGHSVASHSFSHPAGSFWRLGPRGIATQIESGVAALPLTPPWFRAPVGMKNPFVHPQLARRGLRLIGWTIRGFDATRDDETAVTRRIAAGAHAGAIVVMHQGRSWSARTVARVVDELLARGYTFVVPDDARLKTKR